MRQVGLEFARAFFALQSSSCRLEMPKLSWDEKSHLQTMALNNDELKIYESVLDAVKRPTWRDELSPDERRDAKKLPHPDLQKLLTVPAELHQWRVQRVNQMIGAEVANKLVAAGENPAQVVDALSHGRGGDRLRRILMDPQLSAATKTSFILAVKTKLTATSDPLAVMKECQPSYKLLGNDASKDGKFKTMEILKAFPIINFPRYGTVPIVSLADACASAPTSDGRIPRRPDGAIDSVGLRQKITIDPTLAKQLGEAYFPAYGRQGVGNLSGCETTIVGGKVDKQLLPAYWMYDAKAGMTLGLPANEVAHALAVDESPDYQRGGVITALPESVKEQYAAQSHIKRPTAIDGLAFDQFQIVEDPSQCFGITAGGMGEVMVAPIPYTQTTPKRTF